MSRRHRFTLPATAIAALLAIGCSGAPSAAPTTSTAAPTAASTPAPVPSATPVAVPPLSGRFTSAMHGITISHPAGWRTRAATKPWTAPHLLKFEDPAADVMYEGAQTDHLFLLVASQPLAGIPGERWAADLAAGADDCGPMVPATIDNASGWTADCGIALVPVLERGYVIFLYTSLDDQAFEKAYDDLFDDILATVDFDPEIAVTASPVP